MESRSAASMASGKLSMTGVWLAAQAPHSLATTHLRGDRPERSEEGRFRQAQSQAMRAQQVRIGAGQIHLAHLVVTDQRLDGLRERDRLHIGVGTVAIALQMALLVVHVVKHAVDPER